MTRGDRAVLLEFCAENATQVERAIACGARRIELCDNLAVGGTSPSPGVVAIAVELAHARSARVMCMVRPRGGDFVYTERELRAMELDLESSARLGADGVVFGCLQPADAAAYGEARERELSEGALPGARYTGGYRFDVDACKRLSTAARTAAERRGRALDITFHMAFDALPVEGQLDAIDRLAEMGTARILTHGGAAGTPTEGNVDRLRRLMAYARGRVVVLPGAGITYGNAAHIARELDAGELHGTRIVDMRTGPADRERFGVI